MRGAAWVPRSVLSRHGVSVQKGSSGRSSKHLGLSHPKFTTGIGFSSLGSEAPQSTWTAPRKAGCQRGKGSTDGPFVGRALSHLSSIFLLSLQRASVLISSPKTDFQDTSSHPLRQGPHSPHIHRDGKESGGWGGVGELRFRKMKKVLEPVAGLVAQQQSALTPTAARDTLK